MTPQSGPIEFAGAETQASDRFSAETEVELQPLSSSADSLALNAHETARSLAWIPGHDESRHFRDRCELVTRSLRPVFNALRPHSGMRVPDQLKEVHAQVFLLEGELQQTGATFEAAHRLPLVRTGSGSTVPRVAAVALDYLSANGYQFSDESFSAYVMEFQQVTVLRMGELWMLIAAMKLALLEQIAERSRRALQRPEEAQDVHTPLRSMQEIKQTAWKLVIEPLIVFDKVLREDPASAYARMDGLRDARAIPHGDRYDCGPQRPLGNQSCRRGTGPGTPGERAA
jgi:cyclic beta-1,2-glucan synthetase